MTWNDIVTQGARGGRREPGTHRTVTTTARRPQGKGREETAAEGCSEAAREVRAAWGHSLLTAALAPGPQQEGRRDAGP